MSSLTKKILLSALGFFCIYMALNYFLSHIFDLWNGIVFTALFAMLEHMTLKRYEDD